MDKSPVIKTAEDLRDLVNTEVSDPRTRAMLLRYLEDFEDKYLGCVRREAEIDAELRRTGLAQLPRSARFA